MLPLALEIPTEGLAALAVTGLGAVGGGLKVVWSYWTARTEAERAENAAENAAKTARYKEVLDDKDRLIAAKDAKVEELSKKLSEKSDAHATKIEELMGMTLSRVEGWGDKNGGLVEKQVKGTSELTTQLIALKVAVDELCERIERLEQRRPA